jgi:aminopeptidase YwaD
MRHNLSLAFLSLLAPVLVYAQTPPLLPEKDVAALAQELSGETAKRNLEGITRFHRQRGSQGFHSAAELVAERARAYGLSDVQILQFPADGKIFYGTQRSRPPWDAETGELTEINPQDAPVCDKEKVVNGNLVFNVDCFTNVRTIASYEAQPIVLAEDSESADVTADLIDVADGTKESDYAGKDVAGKIVLAAAQPGAVQDLAVGTFHAAGIVSYAQNQKTAWSGEDENLIRWGHLETFSPNKTFAFMVALKTARGLRERLSKGERIKLHAVVKGGQHPGNLEVVTASIPGADPKLKDEEIAFSCHLDHQRPGANDNASGCVTILEVARTLQKLIAEEKLPRPARTIRFIWPPEIEGTLTLLNGKPLHVVNIPMFSGSLEQSVAFHEQVKNQPPPARSPVGPTMERLSGPELAARIKAVIHMDMVGGGPTTKAVFHVTRGPMSLPSFIHDVAWAFAEFLNEQSYNFAAGLPAEYPFIAPEGGKEALQAMDTPYTMGSDHDVYQDSSFKIPAIYLNDWPDRFIHTNFDTAANIDTTKLKRAAFIGAASGYFLANLTSSNAGNLLAVQYENRSAGTTLVFHRANQLPQTERDTAINSGLQFLQATTASVTRFVSLALPEFAGTGLLRDLSSSMARPLQASGNGLLKFARKAAPRGPVTVFGYDFVNDHTGAQVAKPKLLDYEGPWGEGFEYAYETLNFADGKRNAQQIRDAVSAEYGPVPLELVVEYLRTLEKIGVVEQLK